VGGSTRRSLRRAISLADGWCPFAVSPSRASDWLGEADRPQSFEVILMPPRPLDPVAAPQATSDALGELVQAGATIVKATFVHHSLQHYLEQLEALSESAATGP
jgi:hypothetical protein